MHPIIGLQQCDPSPLTRAAAATNARAKGCSVNGQRALRRARERAPTESEDGLDTKGDGASTTEAELDAAHPHMASDHRKNHAPAAQEPSNRGSIDIRYEEPGSSFQARANDGSTRLRRSKRVGGAANRRIWLELRYQHLI